MPKRKRAFFETSYERRLAKKVLRSAIDFTRKNWFVPKSINEDGVAIAYGSRSGILYLSETNEHNGTEEINPIKALDLVFNNGLSESTNTPLYTYSYYLAKKFGEENFFLASIVKQVAINDADEYGYVYVIDASKANNLTCIPFSKLNQANSKLIEHDESGCELKQFLVQGSSVLPKNIVGAFATQYLAFAFGLSEATLIINPNYSGDLFKKNQLKLDATITLSALKKIKDWQCLTFSVAESNFKSEIHGLDRRFSDYQNVLRAICIEEGMAAIIDKLPTIKQWLNACPFSPNQFNFFVELLARSRIAKCYVSKMASVCLQFEQGFTENNNPIRSLPEEIRHKIYTHVYPFPHETKPAANFAREILKFRNYNFFKKSLTLDKALQTDSESLEIFKKGKISSSNDEIIKPSTSGLN